MKNIKVNYIDENAKRTSTTINGTICWHFFKGSETYKNDEGGGHKAVIREVQEYVNSITISAGSLNKNLIEDLMVHEIIENALNIRS